MAWSRRVARLGQIRVVKSSSGMVQVTVRLGSNLKSILSLTLVDVKLVIIIKGKVLENSL